VASEMAAFNLVSDKEVNRLLIALKFLTNRFFQLGGC